MPVNPQLDPLFESAGAQWNVDPDLLKAVHLTETGGTGRWDLTSPAGARGGMQFIPSTGAQYGVEDPTDPQQAIPGAAHLLSDLLNTYEGQVGAGPQALSMALRGYNAGAPSRWNNAETTAYPGAVAKYYSQLKQPAGSAPAQVAQAPAPTGGSDPNTWAAQHGVAIALDSQGNLVPQNEKTGAFIYNAPGFNYGNAGTNAGGEKPMNGIDALAAAGQPQAAAPAQPSAPAAMSDDDLLHGFVNGTLPFMPKAPAPLTVPGMAGAGTGAAPSSAAMPAPSAQPGGSPPAIDVPGLVNTFNTYRSFPAGVGIAQGALGLLQKMAPEGYSLNQDGSLALRQGYTQGQQQLKAAGAAGDKLETIGPGGQVSNMPGALDATRNTAEATAAGTGMLRPAPDGTYQNAPGVVAAGATKEGAAKGAAAAAEAPYKPVELRPGNLGTTAQAVHDATSLPSPQIPPLNGAPGAAPVAGIYNDPSVSKNEDEATGTFGKARDSFIANQNSIQNLQNFLQAASTVGTGRGTNLSGDAAAWVKSIGVDPQKLSLADPAEVEKMQKAANQMIVSTVKGISSRPAYADFNFVSQGTVDPEKQPEANRAIAGALLGRMQWENQMFKDWDAARRGGTSIGGFDLPAWAESHPMPAFQSAAYAGIPQIPDRGVVQKGNAAPSYQEGQTATNPQNGAKLIRRGGQWVPLQ